MPALPVITNVWRCTFNWSVAGGQLAVNVIHIRDESGAATAGDIFTAIDAAADQAMWGAQTDGASVHQVDLLPLDGVHATSSFPTGSPAKWTGGSGGTTWTPQNANLIKVTTGLRGRSHRGRVFLPFVDESAGSDGVMLSATVTSVTAAWQDFDDDLSAGTPSLSFGVASYKLAQFNEATSILAESLFGTQRRRQGRLRGA